MPPRIAAAKPFTPIAAPTKNAVCVSGATATPARAPRPAASANATVTIMPALMPTSRAASRRIAVARMARPNAVLR